MVFKCSVCGYVYDEEAEGKPFSEFDGMSHVQTAGREV